MSRCPRSLAMTRITLIRLDVALGIIAIALLAIVAIGASGILIEHDLGQSDDGLPVSDKPLMTECEIEHAKESGIATYQIGDTIYIDESLSPEYYEEN